MMDVEVDTTTPGNRIAKRKNVQVKKPGNKKGARDIRYCFFFYNYTTLILLL